MEGIETTMISYVPYGPIEMASELTPGISKNNIPGNNKSYDIFYLIGGVLVVVAGIYLIKKAQEISAAPNKKEEI